MVRFAADHDHPLLSFILTLNLKDNQKRSYKHEERKKSKDRRDLHNGVFR